MGGTPKEHKELDEDVERIKVEEYYNIPNVAIE
jgi:hypothetical protein